AAPCPGEESCREGACRAPTERMRSQAEAIGELVETLGEHSAWHETVDLVALKERETMAVLRGDGADATYFTSAWRTMNAIPQGHQSLSPPDRSVCGVALPWQNHSPFGVCGRPGGGGLAITVARE